MSPPRAEIVVDVGAIRANVRLLRELAGPGTAMMTVIKADGYGHGIHEAARAARVGGAEWLGVATLDEALSVRSAGDTGRLLSWLAVPGEDYAAAIEHDVDVTAYTVAELREIVAAARRTGRPARLQLKVDTGLSRGGSTMDCWPTLVVAARDAEVAGRATVTGIWSHFACSDEPDHPSNDVQERNFRQALDVARPGGPATGGPAPRQLGGGDPAPECSFRPREVWDRQLRSRPGTWPDRTRLPDAGDDGPGRTGGGQAHRKGSRSLLRAQLDRRR